MIKTSEKIVTADLNGERFDLACVQLFDGLSRKKIKSIIDSGGAYINKRRVQVAKTEVKTGDKVEVFWDNRLEEKTAGQLKPENVLLETDSYFVIHKPAGIPSQATLISSTDTIIYALQKLNPKYDPKEILLVHRLDKDTSGIMILAKTKKAQSHFENLFREKKIFKTYHAICLAVPREPNGLIKFPIQKDNSRQNAYMAVRGKSSSQAKAAETEYETLQIFKKANASLVSCFPKTGRTHQIRVHMSAIGCPIAGDKTYAQGVIGHSAGQMALRHMLHAHALEFIDDKGVKRSFQDPYPEDFDNCLKSLSQLN